MKSLIVFIWLLVLVLATSWFFFWPGMFYLHDFLHTARVAEMARALQDGHFPARWSENFGFGYGMPLFEFYAPLPFYVGAVFALLGVPALMVTKLLFILCNLFTVVGSYLMGKTWYGKVGGLLAAAAVSLAPYRAVNLYVRGALSEAWGIMAIVWIVYFIFQTCKGAKYGWVGLALSLTALFLSHNVLTMLFLPFSVAIAVITLFYHWNRKMIKRSQLLVRMGLILVSYVFAIAMASFYLFPAYLEKDLTQVQDTIVGGYFDYSLHFVYLRQFFTPTWGYGGSNWGPDDGISFFLGYGQLLALFLSFVTLLIAGRKVFDKNIKSISRPLWLWCCGIGVLFIGSILLATEKSIFVWRAVELLHFTQFPWRFLSVSLVLGGLLTPAFLYTQQSFVKRWLLGWLVLLVFFGNLVFFKPKSFIDDPHQYYTADPQKISSSLSEVLPDYLPLQARAISDPPVSIVTCADSCSVVSVEADKTAEKTVKINANQQSEIIFAVHYFPGWYAEVNGMATSIYESNGLIAVQLLPGEHTVSIKFGSTPTRRVSDMVSLSALIAFGVIVGVTRIKKV